MLFWLLGFRDWSPPTPGGTNSGGHSFELCDFYTQKKKIKSVSEKTCILLHLLRLVQGQSDGGPGHLSLETSPWSSPQQPQADSPSPARGVHPPPPSLLLTARVTSENAPESVPALLRNHLGPLQPHKPSTKSKPVTHFPLPGILPPPPILPAMD